MPREHAQSPSADRPQHVAPVSTDAGDGPERLATFQAWLTLLDTEGTRIWTRFSAMVVGNSVIASLLGAVVARQAWSFAEAAVLLGGALFGMAMCRLWWTLMARGWRTQSFYVQEFRKITLTGQVNPMAAYIGWREEVDKSGRDSNQEMANAVIRLFTLAYVLAFLLSVGALGSLLLGTT